jgi:hypothetical protein
VTGVKYLEETVIDLQAGIAEQQHTGDAGCRTDERKWSVVLEF